MKHYTLNKKYNISKFKECKNIWLNYIQVEKDFSRVQLLFEKQKKKITERQDDIRDFYLYKNWRQDDESTLRKMFDSDWGYTKIFRVIKGNDKELNKVKKVLWKYFPKLKELFTLESGMSSYPCISWNDFTAFCNFCQLVDKNLNLSSLDMIFIATNVSIHEYSGNSERALSRYEFLEILVRLAVAKYGSTMEPHKALITLLEENIFKYCNPEEVSDFRRNQIWTRDIEEFIKRNDIFMTKLFQKFCHGVKNYFTSKDALEMCMTAKLKITEKSINLAYSCAKCSVIDTVKDPSLNQKMGYPEFIVCLIGIANEYFKDDLNLNKELTLAQKVYRLLQCLQV